MIRHFFSTITNSNSHRTPNFIYKEEVKRLHSISKGLSMNGNAQNMKLELDRICEKIISGVSSINFISVSTCLSSLARMKHVYSNDNMVNQLCKCIPRVAASMNAQGVSNSLYALGLLDHRDNTAINIVCAIILRVALALAHHPVHLPWVTLSVCMVWSFIYPTP